MFIIYLSKKTKNSVNTIPFLWREKQTNIHAFAYMSVLKYIMNTPKY